VQTQPGISPLGNQCKQAAMGSNVLFKDMPEISPKTLQVLPLDWSASPDVRPDLFA